MKGTGETLDERVATGELTEITPGTETPAVPVETPAPPAEGAVETPAGPEVPETPAIPQENLEGERRRLQEKTKKLEEENDTLRSQLKQPEPKVVHVSGSLSPYRPDDTSSEAEEYWTNRERTTGLDRKVIYEQEQIALRAASYTRKRERTADENMQAALNYALSQKPYAAKYRSEIETELKRYGDETRSNAGSVMAVVDLILGRHFNDSPHKETPKPKVPEKKPLKSGSTTQTPRVVSVQSSGHGKDVTLTAEVIKWASGLGLFAQGFTNERIQAKWEQKEKIFNPKKD